MTVDVPASPHHIRVDIQQSLSHGLAFKIYRPCQRGLDISNLRHRP